jgi:hypothetical protein
MWALLAIAVVVALGGCAVVFGSGSAALRVDRKIEVASDNEGTVNRDVQPKEKTK